MTEQDRADHTQGSEDQRTRNEEMQLERKAIGGHVGECAGHRGTGPDQENHRIMECRKAAVVTTRIADAQIPAHDHTARAAATPANPGPPSNTTTFGRTAGGNLYQSNSTANLVDMASETLSTTGGGQAHANAQPYLTMNFIIALVGLYPSRG